MEARHLLTYVDTFEKFIQLFDDNGNVMERRID